MYLVDLAPFGFFHHFLVPCTMSNPHSPSHPVAPSQSCLSRASGCCCTGALVLPWYKVRQRSKDGRACTRYQRRVSAVCSFDSCRLGRKGRVLAPFSGTHIRVAEFEYEVPNHGRRSSGSAVDETLLRHGVLMVVTEGEISKLSASY
jgi:hypothetical protein